MPGSTTLGSGHGVDAIDHADARRLASLMRDLYRLLDGAGPHRLTDPQVAALCGAQPHSRDEFTGWVGRMAVYLEKVTAT
ncbi:hypothetical protein V1460_08585 [Streptomyces sp. SCSIO 30461]|uniref:hypothetical protein n=1 Tax=Streptomyces sp. SCSIO 30461 TaxID=3118085 RepID=UPI0030CC31C8